MSKLWMLALAGLLSSGGALAQDVNAGANDTTGGEDPVMGPGDEDTLSPVLVIAIVVGLALLIGVIVAVMGRR